VTKTRDIRNPSLPEFRSTKPNSNNISWGNRNCCTLNEKAAYSCLRETASDISECTMISSHLGTGSGPELNYHE